MISVRFWGTRGSIATPGSRTARYGGNTSCVEVRADKKIFIFDAGTGIRLLGQSLLDEFGSKPFTVNLFISHTHWDHIQGFPFFLPAFRKNVTLNIFGPPGRDRSLDSILRFQMDSDYFPVELGDLKAHIKVKEITGLVTIDDITVEPFYLNHPAMTFGYRLTADDRSVVFATDNEPYRHTLHSRPQVSSRQGSDYPEYLDTKFVEFISGTDLLIGEAQYTASEYRKKVGWGHSSLEDLVEFAWRADVGQLALFHHDPLHDDKTIDAMVKTAKKLAARRGARFGCFGAREGMKVRIG
ncbi:MAG TPA: MBL fold metallo-hydrolase [Bacteroidota bacterium]|nr:MBL fold metallo-hydrolase [Bacteroidota bacterium]